MAVDMKEMLRYVLLVVDTVDVINDAIDKSGTSEAAIKAVKGIIEGLQRARSGAATAAQIRQEQATLLAAISGNDADADAALHAKFKDDV